MPKVCVWPDKIVKGWDGELPPTVSEYPVVELIDALTAQYDTDAHFTVGIINDESQPRLKKYREAGGSSALKVYRDLGLDPVFSCVAVDVDRPDNITDADAWWANQVVLLGQSPTWATAGWYRTSGGYRLVWLLEEPLRAEAYEALQRRIYAELLRVGVNVDRLPDWTRCFRLPFVYREGKGNQNHPTDFSKMGFLPVDKLEELPDIKAIAYAPLGAGNAWEQDLTVDGHNRNKGLLKLAIMTLRGLPDIPDEYLELFIRAIHDNKCDEPLDDSELRRIINNAKKYRPEGTTTTEEVAATTATRRQVLIAPGELVRALDDTLGIVSQNKGCLYNMGGGLMRLKRDVEGFLVFEEIPLAALRTVVERMIEYVETKGKSQTLVSRDVPKDLIHMLAEMADYGDAIWKLQEILTTPTLDPKGQPLTERGFHEKLEIYLDCPDSLVDLDLSGDPQAAFDFVRDLLWDIPFETEPEPGPKSGVHASVAMASFITPVIRTAIEGPIPIVLFDSTTRGSGKGLLADLTSIIATGRKAVIQPYVNETEFEKRVTALLQLGLRTVVIDNIDRPFGGPTLDALLTADMWTGRVLGETKMIKFRSRAHWMATGNNIQIQGDLDRRAIRCYLSPNMEQPEKRDPKNYKYPEILKHVRFNRREYVQAILTFMRAYIVAGCPQKEGIFGLGSFEEWSRIVRGAIMHYGMSDPVASQEALRQDGAANLWSQFLNSCKALWKDDWFSAREVFDNAFRQGSGVGSKAAITQLEAALEELLGSGQPSVRGVSFIMKRWLNRVVDGKKLVKSATKDRNKGYVFRVEELSSGNNA